MNQRNMTLFAFVAAIAISLGIYVVNGSRSVAAVSFAFLFVIPAAWIWWPQEGRDWRGRYTKRK